MPVMEEIIRWEKLSMMRALTVAAAMETGIY
jgi:hypothetical protein